MPSNDERARVCELRERARAMRANPTHAEKRLWAMLRNSHVPGCKFRRQHVVGSFIVDFACLERQLIVEGDGSQHADSEPDQRRDAHLRGLGFTVLRFWNNEVLNNPGGVFEVITAALHTPHAPKPSAWAPPSPHAGRGVGDDHA